MQNILIFGATSAMAHAAATHFARSGARFFLVGRNDARLQANANDLRVRGAPFVACATLDINDRDRHAALLDDAVEALGELDIVLVAHGTLPEQSRTERDIDYAIAEFETNATNTLALLGHIANRLERQGVGTLAVITSVAGDRGRKSNYLYGAAKAAVTTFTSGLRARLHGAGVSVVTIKPGLVDTPMTAHLKKGPLFTSSEQAGQAIYEAIRRRKSTVYVPGYWRLIMLVIRLLPEAIFKRLNLAA